MTNDTDKTQVLAKATSDSDDATVLSPTQVNELDLHKADNDATRMLADADATQMISDATIALQPSKATVLSGATEAMNAPAQPMYAPRVGVGSVINNRFTLVKLLGRGGMGEVYLATDARRIEAKDKDPYIAIKLLGDHFKTHKDAFIALQREQRKTSALAHPNIVTVNDFDRQGDIIYVTMEALSGKPMDEEIRSEKRSPSEAIALITQCAKGLAYAHEKGFVHSDLKPGNIFLTENGTVKLLDFGIARAFTSGKDLQTNKDDNTVFDAGELGALTPAYASLEMIEGKEPHPADDVYALGLIAYELLTGKHPFNKKMAVNAKEEGLKPEKIAGINKQQWQAIEAALAFDRDHRIQHAQAFLDKFTAKSKLPLYLTATVTLMAFIALGSLYIFKEAEMTPDIDFADLPIATQQTITGNIEEAKTALSFDDVNGALIYLNKGFLLHPYNPAIEEQLDIVINKILNSPEFNQQPATEQKQYIDELMKYESLSTNKTLQDYKDKL